MSRIFAIGDIHGCFDKLVALMELIDIDFKCDTLLFLGDYIDRGRDSKRVVEFMISLREKNPNTIFLKGNHEGMFLDYLNQIDRFTFLYNGGRQTLDSYLRDPNRSKEGLIPLSHLRFFQSLHLYHETDDYIFVHAGLKEGVRLEDQDEKDLLWIRGDFINSDFDFGKLVIFGHTPFKRPLVQKNKIGIDTGAVYGNRLTCLELPAMRFYSV
nr:serine/threonine protein phosphatase [Desulfobacterales bacterium]